MNRRQFLCASAASFACIGHVSAATYDLVIKGGRVIDPSVGLDAVRDVAIVAGRIAAVEADISGGDADTIDARGKIVAPGLIDIHTHAARVAEGAGICLQDGVTGWVDCGSAGADNIDQIAAAARAAPQIGRVLVNISRTGNTSGELMDINRADVALARGAIARHRDVVIGLKARLTRDIAGTNDLEGLRRAQEAAAPFSLPVMIHMGQSVSPMRAILPLLKRGDIVTHLYAPAPNGILDDDGRLLPDVAAARRRGVIFDLGNGANAHLQWDVVERATRQGFWPDTLSTDWTANSRDNPSVIDFPNVMSKFIMLGLSLAQVIACSSVNAARVFPAFDDRGTLNIGAPADVAIMELREGTFAFVDNYKGTRTGQQRLFPVATVLAGKRTPTRA